jgi:hypothetical protein
MEMISGIFPEGEGRGEEGDGAGQVVARDKKGERRGGEISRLKRRAQGNCALDRMNPCRAVR